MGRLKITEKPGVWPYVLVNDFKSPPYFAYEHVDEDGKRSFIRVLKGPEEELEPMPIMNLTKKRKATITKFLRETLKTPSKYGEFMSKDWIQELLKLLDLFDERYIEARSHAVEKWLKNAAFKQLVKKISESIEAAAAAAAAEGADKVSEECTTSPSSSSSSQEGQKRQASEKDSSDDDDLFTPVVARVNVHDRRKAAPEEDAEPMPIIYLTTKRKATITKFLLETLKTPSKYGEFMSKDWIQELLKTLDLFDERYVEARSHAVKKWLKDEIFKELLKKISESIEAAAAAAAAEAEDKISEECTPYQSSCQNEPETDSSDEDDLFVAVRVKRRGRWIKLD